MQYLLFVRKYWQAIELLSHARLPSFYWCVFPIEKVIVVQQSLSVITRNFAKFRDFFLLKTKQFSPTCQLSNKFYCCFPCLLIGWTKLRKRMASRQKEPWLLSNQSLQRRILVSKSWNLLQSVRIFYAIYQSNQFIRLFMPWIKKNCTHGNNAYHTNLIFYQNT